MALAALSPGCSTRMAVVPTSLVVHVTHVICSLVFASLALARWQALRPLAHNWQRVFRKAEVRPASRKWTGVGVGHHRRQATKRMQQEAMRDGRCLSPTERGHRQPIPAQAVGPLGNLPLSGLPTALGRVIAGPLRFLLGWLPSRRRSVARRLGGLPRLVDAARVACRPAHTHSPRGRTATVQRDHLPGRRSTPVRSHTDDSVPPRWPRSVDNGAASCR